MEGQEVEKCLVKNLTNEQIGKVVKFQGITHSIRTVGEETVLLVVRQNCWTVQCLVSAIEDSVSAQVVKFASTLSLGCSVDVEGIVYAPSIPYTGATQQVEIRVRKLYCAGKVDSPFPSYRNIFPEITLRMQEGKPLPIEKENPYSVKPSHPSNSGIYLLKDRLEIMIGEYLEEAGLFQMIYHYPKVAHGPLREYSWLCEKLDFLTSPEAAAYSGGFLYDKINTTPGCSTDTVLHNSNFVDVQVLLRQNDYSGLMDFAGEMFLDIFNFLNTSCAEELQAIKRQYPFQDLKYTDGYFLKLKFDDGVKLLMEADINCETDSSGDLTIETKRKLGQLVLKEHDTDFYILYEFPRATRPFYVKTCSDNSEYCSSFDVFIRGEAIISGGAQHVNGDTSFPDPMDNGMQYGDLQKLSEPLRLLKKFHGGFGFELERLLMLFIALDDIRKTSETE